VGIRASADRKARRRDEGPLRADGAAWFSRDSKIKKSKESCDLWVRSVVSAEGTRRRIARLTPSRYHTYSTTGSCSLPLRPRWDLLGRGFLAIAACRKARSCERPCCVNGLLALTGYKGAMCASGNPCARRRQRDGCAPPGQRPFPSCPSSSPPRAPSLSARRCLIEL
jgi:hypothetical protein